MSKIQWILVAAFALFLFGSDDLRPDPLPTPSADGEIFLYRMIQRYKPDYYPLNQGQIGTCVAVGHKGAVDGTTAVRVWRRDLKKFVECSAESIYGGARNEGQNRISGSFGDGSNGWAAVGWLNKVGGIIWQQPYPDYSLDLSHYDVPRAKQWGAYGNGGKADGRTIPGKFDTEAAKNPLPGAAKVRTIPELDAALDRLCFVTICSDMGFNSPRDKDGFCRPSGIWPHCMHITARRNGGRKGYLVQNSWGAYIRGDGLDSSNKYKDQPDGSFYVEPQYIARILAQGDSWALSADAGFKAGDIPPWLIDADATTPEPEEDPIGDKVEPLSHKPSDLFRELIKPELKPVATVLKTQTVQAAGDCANGQCSTLFRRRWFR